MENMFKQVYPVYLNEVLADEVLNKIWIQNEKEIKEYILSYMNSEDWNTLEDFYQKLMMDEAIRYVFGNEE